MVACAAGCGNNNGTVGPTSANFGDPQVLGLAVVETDHQVIVAQAALDHGLFYPQVQEYATRVIAEFGPARDRLLAIGTAQGIAVDQTTVEAKDNLGDDDITPLAGLTGVEVDKIYMPDSVHDMQKGVEIWDNSLLPNVTNAALRAELENTRVLFVNEAAAGQQVLVETGLR
jgi:predicted outer membrane protein